MTDVGNIGSLSDVYVTQPNGKRALAVNSGGAPLDIRPPGVTAFGDSRVSQIIPIAGWSFQLGINPAIVKTELTGSGSVTAVDSHAVVSSGSTAGSTSRMETVKTFRYIPGIGGVVRFTSPFSGPATDGYSKVGLFKGGNGWGFGYNGNQFGVFRESGGVTEWIYQDDWNGDEYPNLDPTKGTPFEISFQWLGYGAQYFKASLPDGNIVTLHTIEYANQFEDVSVKNPNLSLAVEVSNGTTAEDVFIRTPSGMCGLEGKAFSASNSFIQATDNQDVALPANTEYPVLSLYLNPMFNSVFHQTFVQALRLSITVDGARSVLFRAYAASVNPLTNSNFQPINAALGPVEVDKVATAVNTAAAVQIGTFSAPSNNGRDIELEQSEFFGYPGQYIIITASASVSNIEVTAGVSFRQFL